MMRIWLDFDWVSVGAPVITKHLSAASCMVVDWYTLKLNINFDRSKITLHLY